MHHWRFTRSVVKRIGPAVRRLPPDIRRVLRDDRAAAKHAVRVHRFGEVSDVPSTKPLLSQLPPGWPSLPRTVLPRPFVAELENVWLVGRYATPVTSRGEILLAPYRNLSWSFLERENEDVIEFVRRKRFLSRPERTITKPVLSLVSRFDVNYFHWMTELLPQLGELEEWCDGTGDSQVGVLVRGELPRFVQDSIALAGWSRAIASWSPSSEPVFVPLLLLTSYPGDGLVSAPWALRWVRQRLLASGDPGEEARLIFISRRPGGWRSIVNHDEVVTTVRDCGFEVMHAEELGLAEQLAHYRSARALAGQHGAGLVNLMFLPVTSPTLEIRGSYGGAEFVSVASGTGHRLHGLRAEPLGDDVLVDVRSLRPSLTMLAGTG